MLEKVQSDRLAKLEQVRNLGIDPYGGRYDSAETIAAILKRYEKWEVENGGSEGVKAAAADKESPLQREMGDAAGRLILRRDMGKMMFAHLRDETGEIQIALRKNALDEQGWALAQLLDLGDLVAVAGPMERTRTGEITIWADKLTLLTKALLPMPEKFHGLSDVETRYRQRYLDLMANPESMATFQSRIKIINKFRELLNARSFLEVETPVLQAIYGGAAARPFTTHHNTLDADLFLRISPELFLKRLLVGGMNRVYEFSRNFRNEGIDTRHNPEFTLLELYQAYADYNVMMEITEELVSSAAQDISPLAEALEATKKGLKLGQTGLEAHELQKRMEKWSKEFATPEMAERTDNLAKVHEELSNDYEQRSDYYSKNAELYYAAHGLRKIGKVALPYGSRLINYTRPWPRRKYADLLKEHAGVDWKNDAAVREKARQLGLTESNKDLVVVVNDIFELVVEPKLAEPTEVCKLIDVEGNSVHIEVIRPTFVIDYPAELCPLTRRKADDPSIALRFECFVAGMEIANAYTELNDPAVQEENFRQQLRGEAAGETMRVMDEDFVTALRHGMPPAGGLGIGIDRVIMLLTNTQSIRDVVLFPMLRQNS